jgi:NhaP-type Na+/H+ or K+/H+ antiporter
MFAASYIPVVVSVVSVSSVYVCFFVAMHVHVVAAIASLTFGRVMSYEEYYATLWSQPLNPVRGSISAVSNLICQHLTSDPTWLS